MGYRIFSRGPAIHLCLWFAPSLLWLLSLVEVCSIFNLPSPSLSSNLYIQWLTCPRFGQALLFGWIFPRRKVEGQYDTAIRLHFCGLYPFYLIGIRAENQFTEHVRLCVSSRLHVKEAISNVDTRYYVGKIHKPQRPQCPSLDAIINHCHFTRSYSTNLLLRPISIAPQRIRLLIYSDLIARSVLRGSIMHSCLLSSWIAG
jgi:hypothetical protein